MWVGDARWLQTKVTGAPLDEVSADIIDSMGLSRSLWKRTTDAVRSAWRGKGAAVARAGGQPAIVSRGQWGADESLRKDKPDIADRARYGVLHHTAGTNSYTVAQAPGIVRGIYAFHTKSRGWSDIGYNFLIDRFGTIYEGRAGGIDKAVIGAHALGFNTNSIGVSVMGNYDGAVVSSATRTAVTKLLAWKFAIHGINPAGTVRIESACSGSCKHPQGKVVNLPALFAHRDVGYTTCPGGSGYADLPALRTAIAARQVDVLANHAVSPTKALLSDSGLSKPVQFSVDLVPAGAWNLVVKYNDGSVVHEQSGNGARAKVSWSGKAGMATGTYWYKFTSGSRTPVIGKFTVGRAPFTPPFSDDERSVHAEGIARLYQLGIAKGCTETTFCPTDVVSREQMASFLSRTLSHLDRPQDTVDNDYFADDDGSVHEPAINTLTDDGVTSGCTDDRFCPRQAIRRGDVAEWIARALDLEPQGTDHFSDDDGKGYEWAINALADAGLTQGCEKGRYCDGAETSRGQMASFLTRMITSVAAQ